MAAITQQVCKAEYTPPERHVRTRVARGTNAAMLEKISERVIKAQTENMRFVRDKQCPCVVAVSRVDNHNLSVKTHHVLMGLHRSVVLYDDDLWRTDEYVPMRLDGTPSAYSFALARDAPVYERMQGFVAVACTCMDFRRRCTSTVGQQYSPMVGPSVNDGRPIGKDVIMGAILGCKHMLAAEFASVRDL